MLTQLIEHYEEGNKTRFAKRLGISPQGISTWLSRGTIDYELVYAKCENINADWLLSGEGSMLRTDSMPNAPVIPATVTPIQSDTVVLRLMDKLDEKDAENKQLQSELRQKSEELAALKAQHPQFQGKEYVPLSYIDMVDSFTDKSSGDYGEGCLPMKKSPSKKSSAGKI